MNNSDYINKRVTLKNYGIEATIKNVIPKRGADGSLGARFIVVDDEGNQYEFRPDEITIHK